MPYEDVKRFDCLDSPPIDATGRSRILSLMSKTMDIKILEFLKGYPEGATSAFIHESVASDSTTIARTEDRLDDLVKDGFVVLAFIEGKTVYAIA